MASSVMLKLSGEALSGDAGFGIDPGVLERLCDQLETLRQAGHSIALVLGGGNLFRGKALADHGMDRVVGDRMGMLATVMNALAMADFANRRGLPASVYSAMAIDSITPCYNRDLARADLQAGKVVLLCAGTGNPFFTTDTAACLRAIELDCDMVLKATNVDGVYSSDPRSDANAEKYDRISYDEVLNRGLGVMDLTAIVLCKENAMPLLVFDIGDDNAIVRVVEGEALGTRVVP
ncbi:MAG: UMP kinase [Pseudomonadota bacterium]